MSAFDLYPEAEARKSAYLEGATPTDLMPTLFQGVAEATVKGIPAGINALAETTNRVLAAVPVGLDRLMGSDTKAQDWWFQHTVESNVHYAEQLTPDPLAVGLAGQITHQFAKVATEAVAGSLARVPGLPLAGPTMTVFGAESVPEAGRLVREGVDPAYAALGGDLAGLAMAGGMLMPLTMPVAKGFGPALVQRLGYGAMSNVAVGSLYRGSMGELMTQAGREDLAAQYHAFDKTPLMIDLVMGLAFGGVGHMMAPKPLMPLTKAELDAVMLLNESLKAQDSAPGIPVTKADMGIHMKALNQAIDQLSRGQPVNVDGIISPNRMAVTEGLRGEGMRALLESYKQDLSALPDYAAELSRLDADQRPAAAVLRDSLARMAENDPHNVTPRFMQDFAALSDTKRTFVNPVTEALGKVFRPVGERFMTDERVVARQTEMAIHLKAIEDINAGHNAKDVAIPPRDASPVERKAAPVDVTANEHIAKLPPDDRSSIETADRIAEQFPNSDIPVGENKATGGVDTMKAAHMIDQANADIAEAATMSKAIKAAVSCFLGI